MAFFRRKDDGQLGPYDTGVVKGQKSILAAAMPMTGPNVARLGHMRQMATTEQWQQEAWYFFDSIGELRGPLVWIANAVSQAELHATALDPDTGKPTGPSDDPVATAAAAQVLGGAAELAGHLRTMALCWQCPGECWIIVSPQGRNEPDRWLVLSGEKVQSKGVGKAASWQYTDPFTGMVVKLTDRDRLVRVWQPHPNDGAKADSAVRPGLPICREVEKASQSIMSTLVSRMAMRGVWTIPNEIDFPQGDHDSVGASVMDQMLSVVESNIANPGQAAGAVPVVFTMPGEQVANQLFQDFATEFDSRVIELRQDALKRLAATLDMPRDVAEGTQGEANHWSAWQVEESTYKIFIEPLLKALGDALTREWFRPTLIAMGKTPEQAELFEIGWDTTAIVARPDDRETLESLYDKMLISDAYMLAENGVSEDAMPDEDERRRRLMEKLVISSPAILSEAGVAEALGLPEISSALEKAANEQRELEDAQAERDREERADNVRALPSGRNEQPEAEDVPAGLVAAAEIIVMQALDRAGGRLLTNQNRGQFKDVPKHELHMHIRPTDPESLIDVRWADNVHRAFGLSEVTFDMRIRKYVGALLSGGYAHNRDDMVWYLKGVK